MTPKTPDETSVITTAESDTYRDDVRGHPRLHVAFGQGVEFFLRNYHSFVIGLGALVSMNTHDDSKTPYSISTRDDREELK